MLERTQEALLHRSRLRARYDNFIGGRWQPPVKGRYFVDPSPIDGTKLCEVARSDADDVERALDAAHAATRRLGPHRAGRTRPHAEQDRRPDRGKSRAARLCRDRRQRQADPRDAQRPTCRWRRITSATSPAASAPRKARWRNSTTTPSPITSTSRWAWSAQIIPWNFPLLMAAWKMAPALATGNCVVIKPASDTPLSLAVLMDLIGDILPAGVLNVVNGHGSEVGAPLASSPRIAKVSFTGETTTGRQIMQYAAENLIPSTMELGGKSPNIFMADVMDADDAFFDKALEGFALFAFNKGEVCTCPSRALVQESIFDKFMEKAVARVAKIRMGDPLDATTMMGAQASRGQLEKILGYIDVGKQEGAQLADRRRTGASRRRTGERLLRAADGVRRPQQDAHLPGRDLRAGAVGHHVQDGGRRDRASATTRSTGWAPACGRATAPWRIASAARSRPAACGPTAITCIRRMRRSAATSSRATAARRTR